MARHGTGTAGLRLSDFAASRTGADRLLPSPYEAERGASTDTWETWNMNVKIARKSQTVTEAASNTKEYTT